MNVSVITVCYNALEDLKKTVESVLAQTYQDMEYIVVDGGSTDGTVEYLAAIRPRFDSRNLSFRWVSERDGGVYNAMNKGAEMASGGFVNYLNAGDVYYSSLSLEQFFGRPIDPVAGVLYGDTHQMFDFGSGIAKREDYLKDNPIMPFCHQSSFVKTDLMREYRFDESYRIIADHDLFFRMHEAGVKFQYIEEVVASYNGQYGLSANNPLMLRLEGLRVHHVDERWYYPLSVTKTYLRYGWIAWFKRNMPTAFTDAWMKRKRKRYIHD